VWGGLAKEQLLFIRRVKERKDTSGAGQDFKKKTKTRKEECVRCLLHPGRGLRSSIDVVVDDVTTMMTTYDLARPGLDRVKRGSEYGLAGVRVGTFNLLIFHQEPTNQWFQRLPNDFRGHK